MKILVIGGSYFFGRWFVQLASKENEITVINRGNIKIGLPNVVEIVADRHDEAALASIGDMDYDCIVDFCAYTEGDISTIIKHFGKQGKRYIFISTVDVYKKGTGKLLTEDSPLEDCFFAGEEGEYIHNKVLLEKELIESCKETGMEHCSLRPSLLYGPANYAPRESMYFNWIKQSGQIYHPVDATGFFQPLYIKDAVLFTIEICKAKSIDSAYNLCPESTENYESWARTLHTVCDVEFEEIPVSVGAVLANNLPLPFPLTLEESERYSGKRIETFGIEFTGFDIGLRRCYELS